MIKTDTAKKAKAITEENKIAVRNIRRDAIDHIKKNGKAEDISQEEINTMTSATILATKQATVAELSEKLKNATSGVVVTYGGITVENDTALRRELRKAGVEYTVVKNTLTRFALDKLGMNEIDSILNGSTSLATSSDPIAPFRIISEYSKKLNERFNIKAAFMEGKILNEQEIAELSTLTSKDDLYSKLAGSLNAIIGGLAVCLAEIVEKNGGSVEAAPAEAAE